MYSEINTMKKLLFLTLSYPETRRSATVQCTHRVMDCVKKSGRYEVHALCLQYEDEIENEIVNGIYVHRVKPSFWCKFQSRIEEKKQHKLERFIEVMQKAATIPFYPNTQPLTTRKYSKAAEKLMDLEHFDIVLSEHHGLMTLIAGCRLAEKNKSLMHVAFLWDPIKGELRTKYLPSSFTNRRVEQLEQVVARNTKLEVSMAIMKDFFVKEGDIASDHRIFLDIPTLLQPEKEVKTGSLKLIKSGSINIVFSGKLSVSERNPLPIIDLLNKSKVAEHINLIFFSIGAKEVIENASKRFRGSIIYHDYIPLVELHTIYNHADYLLNISHINPNMVPSKIFEYMSYGKPIISTFVSEGDAAAKCIKRYPEGLCVDLMRDENENVENLNTFFESLHNPVSFDFIKKTFSCNTPEAYLELIDGICKKNN